MCTHTHIMYNGSGNNGTSLRAVMNSEKRYSHSLIHYLRSSYLTNRPSFGFKVAP